MADERTAYSDSSRRSEQLSCIKLFHRSYGLIYTIFQRFKHFLDLLLILRIQSRITFCTHGQLDLEAARPRGLHVGPGSELTQSIFDLTGQLVNSVGEGPVVIDSVLLSQLI